MDKRLSLPKSVTRIDRGDKVLLINGDIPAWLVTNANGALLLELCNGENTVEEICEAAKDVTGSDETAGKVREFLTLAVASGIFKTAMPCDIPIREERQELSLVQFSISHNCNLNCKYCYATDRVESKYPKMTLADYERVIDQLDAIRPNVSITLTGGEPLLNKDVFAIADYARGKGHAVDLMTNATLVNEGNIGKVKASFNRVTVSMDGSTRERHETFRGTGSYDKTQHALQLLNDAQVPYSVAMTVNRLNIDDVEAMARKYGCLLGFAPLFPAGNAKRVETDISITGKQYYDALKGAAGVNPLGYCEATLDEATRRRRCKCAVGGSEISVSETGDVYPCQLLHYPQFLCGNIHTASISDIYKSSSVISKCAGLTVDNIEGCRECFLRYICGGACRARSFHECGNIRYAGSFCAYEKEAFIEGILNIYSANAIL